MRVQTTYLSSENYRRRRRRRCRYVDDNMMQL